jgi:hypothetical protein
MRTDYLLELEAKLDAELTALSEDPVKNKARISKIKKQIDEMKTWDELLNNKALALIEIDLMTALLSIMQSLRTGPGEMNSQESGEKDRGEGNYGYSEY